MDFPTKHGDFPWLCSKEVWKLNFRQYGEMKMQQPGRNSDVEKVSREKSTEGESQKRDDAGARKGSEVAKHCVFPAGQMRDEKLHAIVARSTF